MRLVIDPTATGRSTCPVLGGDDTELRAATGWEPAIDLDTSLADILARLAAATCSHG